MGGSGGTGADVSFVEGLRQGETSTNDELCPNTGGTEEGDQGIVGSVELGVQAGQGTPQSHGERTPSFSGRAREIVVSQTARTNTGKGKGRRRGGGGRGGGGGTASESFVADELRRRGVEQGSDRWRQMSQSERVRDILADRRR